jgi:hypothetical protein
LQRTSCTTNLYVVTRSRADEREPHLPKLNYK